MVTSEALMPDARGERSWDPQGHCQSIRQACTL
jgi:hypothetical protein